VFFMRLLHQRSEEVFEIIKKSAEIMKE